MDNGFEQKIAMQKKFNRVFREIRNLESKIHQKEGFWIFKTHVYSKESLLNSEQHAKIASITDKIGSDAISWNRFGQLTLEAREIYDLKSDEIEDELKRVNLVIATREPTWWEGVQSFFNDFIVQVERNMPQLARGFLGGFFQAIIRQGLPGLFKTTPQLPSWED